MVSALRQFQAVTFFRYNVTGFQEKSLAGHQGSGHAQQLTHNDGDAWTVDTRGVMLNCYMLNCKPMSLMLLMFQYLHIHSLVLKFFTGKAYNQ